MSRTSAEEADVGSSADVDESTACESDGSAGEQEELNLLQTVKLQFYDTLINFMFNLNMKTTGSVTIG